MVEQAASGPSHMAWFSGSHEGQDGVAIVHLAQHHRQRGWRRVVERHDALRAQGYSNQNTVVFSDDNASLLHFHSQQGAGKANRQQPSASAVTIGCRRARHQLQQTALRPRNRSFDKNRVVPLLTAAGCANL